MKIRALVPFSTGTITMEQYEVREVTDSLGNELISAGVAVEIGGGLPPVTASDAGKVLSVNNSGVWGAQEPIGKKFIVTLTPTAPDMSGTMDKTGEEITAAYEAGKEIVLQIHDGNYNNILNVSYVIDGRPAHNELLFVALFVYNNMLIMIKTLEYGYDTAAYTLTPAT